MSETNEELDARLKLPACLPDHKTVMDRENAGIEVIDNHDRDCLTIRQLDAWQETWDMIHICNWPAFKAAVDQHQRERGGRL